MFVDFFFFKQNTAYEMRISDWISDVCSSDLVPRGKRLYAGDAAPAGGDRRSHCARRFRHRLFVAGLSAQGQLFQDQDRPQLRARRGAELRRKRGHHPRDRGDGGRSEEHTSELQSLMRISYAVFCLKKNNNNIKTKTIYSN